MKGKEELKAARRRAEGAFETIDRLTEQLASAKMRARTVEQLARSVPDLRNEVAALRRPFEEQLQDREVAWALERQSYTERIELLSVALGQCWALLDKIGGSDQIPFTLGELTDVLNAAGDYEHAISNSGPQSRQVRRMRKSRTNENVENAAVRSLIGGDGRRISRNLVPVSQGTGAVRELVERRERQRHAS